MLITNLRVGLVRLEQEEVYCLVKSLGSETELVLYDANFTVKLDPPYPVLLSNLPHRGGTLVLVLLDQSFREAPNSATIASEQEKQWTLFLPSIHDPSGRCHPDTWPRLHPRQPSSHPFLSDTGMAAFYYNSISFARFVRFFEGDPTMTMSSNRTPPHLGSYSPGSTVTAIPLVSG